VTFSHQMESDYFFEAAKCTRDDEQPALQGASQRSERSGRAAEALV